MVRKPVSIPDEVQHQARALGDPTRFGIFRYVYDSGRPVAVAELTSYTQLNHNAVRQHLAVLVSAQLVVEKTEERGRPGRPRLLYSPSPEAERRWSRPTAAEVLAAMLAEVLATGESARQVGHRHGIEQARGQKEGVPPLSMLEDECVRLGCGPVLRRRGHRAEFVLARCPFESAASVNPDAVCDLHLGLAEGMAAGLGGIEVVALVAKNPRRGGCRLVIRLPNPATPA